MAHPPPRPRVPSCLVHVVGLALSGCVGAIDGATADPPEATPDPAASRAADPAPGRASVPPGSPAAPAPPQGAAVPRDQAFSCDPARDKGTTAPRLWRLSALQYDNTLKALLRGAGGGWSNPFSGAVSGSRFNNLAAAFAIPEPAADTLLRSSTTVAATWAEQLKAQFPCAQTLGDDCVRQLVTAAGRRAFRRPMTDEEVARYSRFVSANRAALGGALALQAGLEVMLGSPHFVFRSEVGAGPADAWGRVKLTPYEIASAISYTVTDGPPDDALLAAAEQGGLSTPEQVRSHLLRLFGKIGENRAALNFLREYFPYEKAALVFKDPVKAPYHNARALIESADLLMKDALAQGRPFVDALLTTRSAYVNSDTAQTFGLPRSGATSSFAKRDLPAEQRAGILTQPSFLVAYSHNAENDPIKRGLFVAQSLLCQQLPDEPPANVPPKPEAPTVREALKVHLRPELGCPACHALMDPIGLGFEAYDHTGRFRSAETNNLENGRPVDASGALVGSGDQDGPFNGPRELATKLAASATVEQCFVRHAFRYWLGRDEARSDSCSLAAAHAAYEKAGGDPLELFVSLLTSESFLHRSAKGGTP